MLTESSLSKICPKKTQSFKRVLLFGETFMMNNFDEFLRSEVEKHLDRHLNLDGDLRLKISEIHELLSLIAQVIVIRQDDASNAANVSPATLRRKESLGEIQSFSKPGSRLVYYQLQKVADLKPKIRGTRRRQKQ